MILTTLFYSTYIGGKQIVTHRANQQEITENSLNQATSDTLEEMIAVTSYTYNWNYYTLVQSMFFGSDA
jgi:hypothetical protein